MVKPVQDVVKASITAEPICKIVHLSIGYYSKGTLILVPEVAYTCNGKLGFDKIWGCRLSRADL